MALVRGRKIPACGFFVFFFISVLVGAVVFVLAAGAIGGGVAKHLSAGGFDDPKSENSQVLRLVDREFPNGATPNVVLLVKAKHGTEVRLGGMVTGLQVRTTKTGKRFALFRLEDLTGQVKCVAWSEEFQRYKDLLADDRIHLFEGVVEWGDRAEPDFIVKRVLTFDDARKELTRGLLLRMNYAEDEDTLRKLDAVKRMLERNR